jgi:hypothetical protein
MTGDYDIPPTPGARLVQPEDRDPLMQFFAYQHLPPHLQDVSSPFFDLALTLCISLPRNPERTTALRKLLESKDCAVRAAIYV